jgi:hypothetical protein
MPLFAHTSSSAALMHPNASRRRAGDGLGLSAQPPNAAVAERLLRMTKRAAHQRSVHALAVASQQIADHLQQLVTEETSLHAMEGAMLLVTEVLGLLKSAVAMADVAPPQCEELALTAIAVLIPLIYSPAVPAATKVLHVDSCLHCLLPLCRTPDLAALFARAVDGFLTTEGKTGNAAFSVNGLVARAAESVAAVATECVMGRGFASLELDPGDEAQVLLGLRLFRVAVEANANLIDALPITLAWCIALVGLPHASIRELAAKAIAPLLAAAARDGRATAVAQAAMARLHVAAGAGDDALSPPLTVNPPAHADGMTAIPPPSDFGLSTRGTFGRNSSANDSLDPAAASAPGAAADEQEPVTEANALFGAIPGDASVIASIVVVDAAVSVGLLKEETLDVCLCLLSQIVVTRLSPDMVSPTARPRPAVSPNTSIGGGSPQTPNAAPLSAPSTGTDELLAAALRCLLTVRKCAARQFGRHMASDANGQKIRSLLCDALHRCYVHGVAPPVGDDAHHFVSSSTLELTKCAYVASYSPAIGPQSAHRRLLFGALTYACEVDCQSRRSADPVVEVSDLVLRDLAAWLRYRLGDPASTSTSFASGSAEARMSDEAADIEDPPCCRLAASLIFLCREEWRQQPLIFDVASLAAQCHAVNVNPNAIRPGSTRGQKRSTAHGGTIVDILTIASQVSSGLRAMVVERVSEGLRDAVCIPLPSYVGAAPLRRAVRSCESIGIDEICAEECLGHIANLFEAAVREQHDGSTQQLLLDGGLHVALVETGVSCLKQLEKCHPVSTSRALPRRCQDLVARWVIAVLRFATTGVLSPTHDMPASSSSHYPADVICTLRAAANTSQTIRRSPPFSYMYSLDSDPVVPQQRRPMSLHMALSCPEAVQLLTCLAVAPHPAVSAPTHRSGLSQWSTTDLTGWIAEGCSTSETRAAHYEALGTAAADAVVLLCRAATVSPAGIMPLLRTHLSAAVLTLRCRPDDEGILLGVAARYAALGARERRKAAERTLLDLYREAPIELMHAYSAGVLQAVAVSSGIVPYPASASYDDAPAPKAQLFLTHAAIALIAHTAPAVSSVVTRDMYDGCARALFNLALRDPAPLTVLHCSVALAAIVRCVPLTSADGHAVIHYCLAKLRRLGQTPADATLRRSLLRLAGAVGAGLVHPPRKVSKKSKSIFTSPASQEALKQPHGTAGMDSWVGDDTTTLTCPSSPEDAKLWPARVVIANLRELIRHHGDTSPAQTRFALRGICDIVAAVGANIAHSAPSMPPIVDEVLNCLRATCRRLNQPMLDADAVSVLHVAELCVALLTLLTHIAPWLRGRLGEIADAIIAAERVSRGVLQLALARAWVVIAHVAPAEAAKRIGPIVSAQVRTLSARLPSAATLTAADLSEREAALDVLDALGHHAAAASSIVARCLLQVADRGVAGEVEHTAASTHPTTNAGTQLPSHSQSTMTASPMTGSPMMTTATLPQVSDGHIVDLKLRALQSLARFMLVASPAGTDRNAVAPVVARSLTHLAQRVENLRTSVPVAAQVGNRALTMCLLPRDVRDGAEAAVLSMDAVGFLASVVVHQLCRAERVAPPAGGGVPLSALFPQRVREQGDRCAALCHELGSWPIESEHPTPSQLSSPTSSRPNGPAIPHTPVTLTTPVEPLPSSGDFSRPRVPRSAYMRAVRSCAARTDGDRALPAWDPNNLHITEEHVADAIPRIAKDLAAHSPFMEVRACADVVELSPEIARSLYHVIALPYMTEKVTDDVRATLFQNTLILARSANVSAQQDARLLLSSLAFAEHDTTHLSTRLARRPSTTAPSSHHYTNAMQIRPVAIGHVVPRGLAPKMPISWAEAPLISLCEAALRVGDTATAIVLAEASLHFALQALRGDDRIAWVIRKGRVTFLPHREPARSGACSPAPPTSRRSSTLSPAVETGGPGTSPIISATASLAALTRLSEACTMLLRVTAIDSPSGAAHGLVDALSDLLEHASARSSTLVVPPPVFQALDMHARAIEAYERIGPNTGGLRSVAGKAKSLVATGQLSECLAFCRHAISAVDDRSGELGSTSSHTIGGMLSSTGPPLSRSSPLAASAAGSAANLLNASTVDAASLVDDPAAVEELPPRDALCDYAAFAAWSLGEWDAMSEILHTWTSSGRDAHARELRTSDDGPGSNPTVSSARHAAIASLRRRRYYEAVLALSRRDVPLASKKIQECWALVADAAPGFGPATSASLPGLTHATAELQHLAELEEVAVVAEDPSLQSVAQAHWLRRLEAMTTGSAMRTGLTQQWQRSLAVLALALPMASHAEPFLKLVGVARKQGEVELARTTMRRVLSHSIANSPLYHTAEALSEVHVDPKVLLTVTKCHVEFTGDSALACWAVLRFLRQRSESPSQKHIKPMDMRTVSKCFRKLAKWEERASGAESTRDPLSRIAISSHHFHAVSLNPDYAKPWKRWAVHNLKIAKYLFPWQLFAPYPAHECPQCRRPCGGDCRRRALVAASAHVHCALRGFVTVLELSGADTKIENILNVCNIIFDYGSICSVSRALSSVPYRVPIPCWTSAVAQLVARVLDPRPRVRRVIHETLLRLGCTSPHAVLVPLLATRQTCHVQSVDANSSAAARSAAAAGQQAVEGLLNGLRAAPGGDRVVSEAARLVASLNYTAVLIVEQQYFALLAAINARRSSADDARLIQALDDMLAAWQAPTVPFMMTGVATHELPVVHPLVAFSSDRHARHCNERFDHEWNECRVAAGRFRMSTAEAQRARAASQRGDPKLLGKQLQALLGDDGQPKPGKETDAAATRAALAAAEEHARHDKKEDHDRLLNLVKPFQRLIQELEKYLADVRAVDAREVHPPLAAGKDLSITMPGDDQGTATIASFDARLVVMKSQQRPKQIRVVSSTGAKQLYLLKGREDQRQDERVMQLFRFVNDYLSKSGSQGLTLHRFAVVPLCHTAGLIQWVPDAPTFGSVIREHRGGNGDPNVTHSEREVLNDVLNSYRDYDRLTSAQKLDTFTTLVDSTDCTDFRRWMRLASRSSDAYVSHRRAYVDSLATTSMVGYVLGLGDRHPNNFLVRQSDFRVVHIDFGDCFESAQLRTRIPESVPFRLTRQLIAALDLSGICGAFRSTSEHVVHTMRRHKAGVLALLDSFVHDPTVDWHIGEGMEKERGPSSASGVNATHSAPAIGATDAETQQQKTARRARAALRRVELKLLGLEGPPTVDLNRGAFYNLTVLGNQRSMAPQLCDCSNPNCCSMPDSLRNRVVNAAAVAAAAADVGNGVRRVSPSHYPSIPCQLTPQMAVRILESWWLQQRHRIAIQHQPFLRFKPTSMNYEESIRKTIRKLDEKLPTIAQREMAERAKVPVYDLWHNSDNAASEASSDVGQITPPSFDHVSAVSLGNSFPAVPAGGNPCANVELVRGTNEATQVRRIIDTAVDEVNLSRLYSGWFPWW